MPILDEIQLWSSGKTYVANALANKGNVICCFLRDYFKIELAVCRPPIGKLSHILSKCKICSDHNLGICFWMAVFLSIYGLIFSIRALYAAYLNNVLWSWRPHARRFPQRNRFYCIYRLSVDVVEIIIWLALTLGLLTASPQLLKFWMWKMCVVLLLELILVFLAVISYGTELTKWMFLNFMFCGLALSIVLTVYNQMQEAVDMGTIERIQLISFFDKIFALF